MSIVATIAREYPYVRAAFAGLRRTLPIARKPAYTVREMFEDLARRHGDRLALFSETERLTYRDLNGRANRYARWAQAQSVGKGDVVALLMPNRPEYVCAWLG